MPISLKSTVTFSNNLPVLRVPARSRLVREVCWQPWPQPWYKPSQLWFTSLLKNYTIIRHANSRCFECIGGTLTFCHHKFCESLTIWGTGILAVHEKYLEASQKVKMSILILWDSFWFKKKKRKTHLVECGAN